MPITLWSDDSEQSLDLIAKLKKAGYVVDHILSATERPIVQDGNSYCSDYSNIYFRYHLA